MLRAIHTAACQILAETYRAAHTIFLFLNVREILKKVVPQLSEFVSDNWGTEQR